MGGKDKSVCPVCSRIHNAIVAICDVCGFEYKPRIDMSWISMEDGNEWYTNIVYPYMKKWYPAELLRLKQQNEDMHNAQKNTIKAFMRVQTAKNMHSIEDVSSANLATPKNTTLKVGDEIEIGSYFWKVLALYDDAALLITQCVIDQRPFSNKAGHTTWEESELKEYLNNELLFNSFTSDEQRYILTAAELARLQSEKHELESVLNRVAELEYKKIEDRKHGFSLPLKLKDELAGLNKKLSEPEFLRRARYIYPEINAKDCVFLLSKEEAKSLWKNSKDRMSAFRGHASQWWLRSIGNGLSADFIDENGCIQNVDEYGYKNNYSIGVRPAILWRLHPPINVGDEMKIGGINWRVLDVQDGRALLLSDMVLEKEEYNWQNLGTTWEACTLRKYLNNEFLNKLSEENMARIAETMIVNEKNQWYGTDGGAKTTDKVFLLSIEEVARYFGDSGQLKNRPEKDGYLDDIYNKERVALDTNGSLSHWWLRSPGVNCYTAAFVLDIGCIRVDGVHVSEANVGVRPALWLNL